MRRLMTTLAALVCAAVFYAPQPAQCSYCPTFTCYGNCGTFDCECLRRGGDQGGECVSLNAVPDLLAAGYERVQ